MSMFIARVEVHEAEEETYNDLHGFMEDVGFKRTLKTNSGEFRLPDATYIHDGGLTADLALIAAQSACDLLKLRYGLVVISAAAIQTYGLLPALPPLFAAPV